MVKDITCRSQIVETYSQIVETYDFVIIVIGLTWTWRLPFLTAFTLVQKQMSSCPLRLND